MLFFQLPNQSRTSRLSAVRASARRPSTFVQSYRPSAGSISSHDTGTTMVLRRRRSKSAQCGRSASRSEAVELPSSPPRIRNGRPSTISCRVVPLAARCGGAAARAGAVPRPSRMSRRAKARRILRLPRTLPRGSQTVRAGGNSGRLHRRRCGFFLGGLLGAEGVAAVGAGGHRLPGGGGAQAAVADVVERRRVGIGMRFGGAGHVEIVLGRHSGVSSLSPPMNNARPSRGGTGSGSGGLDVDRAGLAAAVGLELVGHALVALERAETGALDGADVDEGVVAAALGCDEAIAL